MVSPASSPSAGIEVGGEVEGSVLSESSSLVCYQWSENGRGGGKIEIGEEDSLYRGAKVRRSGLGFGKDFHFPTFQREILEVLQFPAPKIHQKQFNIKGSRAVQGILSGHVKMLLQSVASETGCLCKQYKYSLYIPKSSDRRGRLSTEQITLVVFHLLQSVCSVN